jgi:hypothetical protein
MKRWVRTYWEGEKFVKVVMTTCEKDDVLAAIGSGIPWKEPQFPFLDYDENYQKAEWEYIVKTYSMRRALIVESSPERYWFASFSPKPIADIAEMMFHSSADKLHCASLLKNGAVYIRLTSKQEQTGYPKIVDAIKNPKGTNFYNLNFEKVFRKILRSFEFDKEEVFMRLIKGLEVTRNE